MSRSIRSILLVAVLMAVPAVSFGAVAVSITIAPPVLPVYSQPLCPGAGYIWTPGYWAWGSGGYYWVPGTWVMAPFIGALWTPGYWGWGSGAYLWHAGYWGPQVGFYGGINYGFGYVGVGYAGGYWNHGAFFYNSAVNNVNRTVVRNVYSKTVINNGGGSRVSYNGGRGGITARPTAAESAAARERRAGPTSAQERLRQSASTNRAQFASANRGGPSTLAAARAEEFPAHGAATASRVTHKHTAHNAGTASTPPRTAARTGRVASSAHSSRQVSNHRAVSHTASRPSQTARRTATTRRAATHSAPPSHSTAPTSHYSARNTTTPARHVASHAPAQHSAPVQHNAPAHENAPKREGGHG